MLNSIQMRSDFSRQRPIRLFGVVSDGLKMIFPHATTRPLKAIEAYRVTVMGLHRYSTLYICLLASVHVSLSLSPASLSLSLSLPLSLCLLPPSPHLITERRKP